MQRLIETSKFNHLRIEPICDTLVKLENSLDWRNWLNLQSESRFFVEKQTLDLNTTTQTTSRNNESLTLKKKDSELLGYQSRANENPNFPSRKITRNVSDVNCAAIMRKKEFVKSLLDRQMDKNQNKSEIVKPVHRVNFNTRGNLQKVDQEKSHFIKKRKQNFEESEIPNNTISSENDSADEEEIEKIENKEEPWNGMINSISDLKETDLKPNESFQYIENSPKNFPENSGSERKTDKKQIFGEKEDLPDNLQTPEFGEFSYGNGFYSKQNSKQKQPNSSKILYKLYEQPDIGFEVKELVHEEFIKKHENQMEDGNEGCEISGSEDAKEASCFVKRQGKVEQISMNS
jgi:hypothetical protein